VVGDERHEPLLARLADLLLGRRARRMVGLRVESAAGGDQVADDQTERQRDDRHGEEVDERARGEAARPVPGCRSTRSRSRP
jgi:hypothetical protein